MSSIFFNGKKIKRFPLGPNSNHPGDSLNTMLAKEAASAAQDAAALQRAKAEQNKRARDENRAIARMIGFALEDESNG